MCNVLPNRRMAFTVCLSVLVAGCGIKWATNRVLSNPDAIAKVGAVYDVLTPRDTTEKLFFIQGDSIVVEKTDTIRTKDTLTLETTNTIRTVKETLRVDTIIKQLPPDNRKIARLYDTIALYKALIDEAKGTIKEKDKSLKRANNIHFTLAGVIFVLGVVIGLLIKFKVKL